MNQSSTTAPSGCSSSVIAPSERILFRSAIEIAAIENVGPPAGVVISTITACARFATSPKIDFNALHLFVAANAPIKMSSSVVIGSKIGGFAGQCSVRVRISKDRVVNVKVFHNASLQCTGIDRPIAGIQALRAIKELIDLADIFPANTQPALRIEDYRTVNINSTYKWSESIRQPELFKILTRTYGLFVMFDTTHYPGVNMKYFHNVANRVQNGRCQCPEPCRGKGDGDKRGFCRRVTVSIFRSGIVLITGSRNYQQLSDVYNFIRKIFTKHAGAITAPTFSLKPTDAI